MFEQQLIESRRQRSDGKRWLTVPVSMVVHAVVVGLAVVATLWAVDDLPEPPIPVSLYVAVQPPAVPQGRPAGPKTPDRPRQAEVKRPPVTQVTVINEAPPPAPEQEDVAETGGDGTGTVPGLDGLDGPGGPGLLGPVKGAEPTPEPEAAPTIIRAGQDIQEPHRLLEIKPVYPEPARRAGIEGPVILEVIVNTEGAVRDVRVLRGMPLGMTESAEDAVRRWRWEPAQYNGRPVEVYVVVTVTFRLR